MSALPPKADIERHDWAAAGRSSVQRLGWIAFEASERGFEFRAQRVRSAQRHETPSLCRMSCTALDPYGVPGPGPRPSLGPGWRPDVTVNVTENQADDPEDLHAKKNRRRAACPVAAGVCCVSRRVHHAGILHRRLV